MPVTLYDVAGFFLCPNNEGRVVWVCTKEGGKGQKKSFSTDKKGLYTREGTKRKRSGKTKQRAYAKKRISIKNGAKRKSQAP